MMHKLTIPLAVAATTLFALPSSAQESAPASADDGLVRGKIGKSVSFDLPGGEKLVMKYCPAGTFLMGSPTNEVGRQNNETQVEVTLNSHFWMAETECTQGQWESLMRKHHHEFRGSNRPVNRVTWGQAQWFVSKLNEQVNLPPGWFWSLPSEAQWEWACRAGSATRFHYGDDPDGAHLKGHAWYADNSERQTHPVGEKKPNAWGLHDLHGNVWEWCLNWGRDRSGSAPDGDSGPVQRGGSWKGASSDCRSARHRLAEPSIANNDFGFRVVLAQRNVLARTETMTSKSAFDVPKEVVAFVERMIKSDPGLRARYAQLIAPGQEEAGGRFSIGRFEAIEWLVPQSVVNFGLEGGTKDYDGIYLVRRPLTFGFRRGYSIPTNVLVQVAVREHEDYDMGKGDQHVLAGSTLTLHFDGFVDPKLTLDRTTSQEEGVAAIEKLGGKVVFVPRFEVEFRDSPVNDDGLGSLQRFTELQALDLFNKDISDAGLKHLKRMTKLERLQLSYTKVTDRGLIHLKGLNRLKVLSLRETKVTDAGLVHLKELANLQQLNLEGTEVTDAGLKNLQAGLSNCEVIH